MKLYNLLASLDAKELQHLQLFLGSKWVTSNPIYYKMIAYLLPYHPYFDKVDKIDYLAHLTGSTSKNIQYLYDRSRELSQLIERFMLFTALPKNHALQHQLKLATFKDKGLVKDFLDETNNAIQTYEKARIQHWENTYNCWYSYQQLQDYPVAAQLFVQKNQPSTNDYLQLLDEYYLLSKLKHSCNVIALNRYNVAPPTIPLLKLMLKASKKHFLQHEMIQMYSQLLRIHMKWQETIFHKLHQRFMQQYNLLQESDRFFILLSLVNLVSLHIKPGYSLLFSLYQKGVDDQLFSHKMPLRDATFLNICTVGAILNKKEWTTAFMNSHRQYLPPDIADTAYQLAQALLLFHTGKLQSCLDLLNHMLPPKAYIYKARIYFLRLRCLLELQLQDNSFLSTLVQYAATFRKFLQRNQKMSLTQKTAYRNSIVAILKIANINDTQWRSELNKQAIHNWIIQQQNMVARSWLLEKLK